MPSRSESRRLILQGCVRIDGEQVFDIGSEISIDASDSILIQAGKRKYIRLMSQKK